MVLVSSQCDRVALVVVIAAGCGGARDTDPFGGHGDVETGGVTAGPGEGGDPATGGGTASDEAGEASGADSSSGTTKLDVGAPETAGVGDCDCQLDYIWIANATQGTVSKIDTSSMVEEARYVTRPDGDGNPSRTSVNLAGDVAVANRHGGLVKFWAEIDDCVESNGMAGIQTSTGKDDVLDWDVEECRAWYVDFPTTNQRPVAWFGGNAGPEGCDADGAQLWTVTSATPSFPGIGGPGGVIVYLLDGDDGSIEETIAVDAFPGGNLGAYGGAVDAGGNLWFTSMGFSGGTLARVDKGTFDVELHPIPPAVGPYGITVDHDGRVWLSSILGSSAARFDPVAVQWDTVSGFINGSGLAEGPDGLMYVSAGDGVYTVGLDSMQLGPSWQTDEVVKGVAFDKDAMLWAITWQNPDDPASMAAAFKIDPSDMTVVGTYAGLDGPYTYSDMTGHALGNVVCPPAG